MRVTKADLQDALKRAAEFNQLELVYVTLPVVFIMEGWKRFIPVCQYGRGMLPLRGEYGVCGNQRLLTKGPLISTVCPRPYSLGIDGEPRLLRKKPK